MEEEQISEKRRGVEGVKRIRIRSEEERDEQVT